MGRAVRRDAARLYGAAVDHARRPAFFADLGVADTVEGRFELIALHVHLICRTLSPHGGRVEKVAQALFDTMCADLDRNMRELGVGDLSVGKKVKAMAEAYYGRAEAYEGGLAGGPAALAAAVARNLNIGEREAAAMAGYIRDAAAYLKSLPVEALLAVDWQLPQLPPVAAARMDVRR